MTHTSGPIAADVREPLTDRQQEVLRFVENHRHAHGFAPTLREIGDGTGIGSTNGVRDHLNVLIRKGYLRRDRVKARGLVLVRERPATWLAVRCLKDDGTGVHLRATIDLASGVPSAPVTPTARRWAALIRALGHCPCGSATTLCTAHTTEPTEDPR